MTDHTLWCWGGNEHGQLGDGTTLTRAAPTPVSADGDWQSVDVSDRRTCAIKLDGSLWCWGDEARSPQRLDAGTGWFQVSVGESSACALRDGGALWCWGKLLMVPALDELLRSSVTPVPVPSPTPFSTVSVGDMAMCALDANGALRCWGQFMRWEEGPDPRGPAKISWSNSSARVGEPGEWQAVDVTKSSTCAVRDGGTLWCWSNHLYDTDAGAVAVPASARVTTESRWERPIGDCALRTDGTLLCGARAINGTWSSVARSGVHACGVRADATTWCWGNNHHGQLGLGLLPTRGFQVAVQPGSRWRDLSASFGHAHAVRSDGTLWFWGTADRRAESNIPMQIGSVATWRHVASGQHHACGVQADGSLWCWGDNGDGQLGVTASRYEPSPVRFGSGTSWRRVAVSNFFTCATETGGALWCWGWNSYGALGQGTSDNLDHPHPNRVGDLTTRWTELALGWFHACAVRADGSLWCWGANAKGALGDGTTTDRFTPTRVGTGAWSKVCAGHLSTCGVTTDGAVWCWGHNEYGTVGDGTSSDRNRPVRVVVPTPVADVQCNGFTSCALGRDGSIWCWGRNYFGEFGDGTTTPARVPVAVATGAWSAISVGGGFSCWLDGDAGMFCSGRGLSGELGNGSTFRDEPVQIQP